MLKKARRARQELRLTLRDKFIAGLVILIPLVLTTKALWWLFTYIDGLAEPVAARLAGRPIPGIGFVTTLAIVLLTGVLFSAGPLQRLWLAVEEVLDAVPLVGTVYGTTKKVLSGFGDPENRGAFQRFVFARLPGKTTPGFVTSTFELRQLDGTSETWCAVYVPTNHLYVGDVVILPARDVLESGLSVEDGVGLVLSAGAAMPASLEVRPLAPGPPRS